MTVQEQLEQHILKRRLKEASDPFCRLLNVGDKYEAHGLGIVIEELMRPDELAEWQRMRDVRQW